MSSTFKVIDNCLGKFRTFQRFNRRYVYNGEVGKAVYSRVIVLFAHLCYRSRWLFESPQTYVRGYRLPQIPNWYEVQDTALAEETADPIALPDILGSVYIYLGGIALSAALLVIEMAGNAVTSAFHALRQEFI